MSEDQQRPPDEPQLKSFLAKALPLLAFVLVVSLIFGGFSDLSGIIVLLASISLGALYVLWRLFGEGGVKLFVMLLFAFVGIDSWRIDGFHVRAAIFGGVAVLYGVLGVMQVRASTRQS